MVFVSASPTESTKQEKENRRNERSNKYIDGNERHWKTIYKISVAYRVRLLFRVFHVLAKRNKETKNNELERKL